MGRRSRRGAGPSSRGRRAVASAVPRAIADPTHERQGELIDWIGGDSDQGRCAGRSDGWSRAPRRGSPGGRHRSAAPWGSGPRTARSVRDEYRLRDQSRRTGTSTSVHGVEERFAEQRHLEEAVVGVALSLDEGGGDPDVLRGLGGPPDVTAHAGSRSSRCMSPHRSGHPPTGRHGGLGDRPRAQLTGP